MKRLSVLLLALFFIINAALPVHAEEKPDYEKYGRIATVVVKEDYPGEAVVEYKYGGRRKLTEEEVMDTFVFIVKENGKDKTILVKVTHLLSDNKSLSLTVEEQK
ncbi:DUF3889 domain-containing protein [Cytobacillus gottheilii]|uniref:DUF3889 domain-containing protein n=2 Tax=Cytobacillus gottheilii TaxID=859144 RepID=A0ABX8FFB9_9BACI|nr:DUF3889 domain-containing protein [Cytobacillus gottheilii]QVY62726.1 DUF3889 domain-containing protein [Cytobacillus gottheilii]